MKKLLITSLLVASTISMVGAGALLTVAPVQAASTGDLIKVSTSAAVYYLGEGNKRYIFPNQATYMTWYSDFSGVQTISQSEIEEMTIGGNVTFRPGTKLIKFPTVAKVYAVEPGGVLRHITSESIASSLYGAEWYKMVGQVPEENWIAYTEGSEITDATYPTGTLVKEEGGSTIYYIDGSEKRPVADETAFNANLFSWGNVLTASSLAAYTAGASITGAEGAIANIDGAEVTSPDTSTGTLTVSLASDTPASTTVVSSAAYVYFTKVNLTASGGDVVVDNMKIKRTGLTNDSYFSEVYLVDVDTSTLHGSEKTLNSNHEVSITKDLTITNGTTKSFYLAATMGTVVASEGALSLTEVNVKGDAIVSGTLPITGNKMSFNSAITIGTATQSLGGTNPSATTSKRVGETDVVFAATDIKAATEDMQVEMITFNNVGTASTGDFGNLDLVVDGTVLATVAKMDSDNNVVFNLSSSPYSISKGDTKSFEVRGDILDGSGRTIQLDHQKKTAIKIKGKTYGFYVTPTYVASSEPYWDNGGSISISKGLLAVSKATLSSYNVAEDSSNQEIGAFYMRATGEPIIITAMTMTMTTTSVAHVGLVDDITFYDENGGSVAGPVAPTSYSASAATAVLTFSDTFTVPTGLHKYIVKGDLDSNWTANETIKVEFDTITAKGETTNQTLTSSEKSGDTSADGGTVTVKSADLNVSNSSSPAINSVAKGTTNYTFARFVLDATQSGEDVRVSRLLVKHTAGTAAKHSDIHNITLYDGDGTEPLNSPQAAESTSGSTTVATSTIDLLESLIIPAGSSKVVTLKADIYGSATATTHRFGLTGSTGVTSYGNTSGNAITEDYTNGLGQLMTIVAGGTLRMANAGSNPAVGLILADSTSEVGVFTFEALYEDVEVQKLGFTFTGSNEENVATLQIWEGGQKIGETPVTGANATVTPSDLLVSPGVSKTLTMKLVAQKVGQSESGDSGEGITIKLSGIEAVGKATGSQTSSLTISGLDNTTTNTQYIFKSIPTITQVALTSSGMSDLDEAELYKFKVSADSKGDIGFAKSTFKITTTTVDVTNLKMYEDGVDKVETAINCTVAESTATTGPDIFNILFDTGIGKEYMLIGAGENAKTYILKGTVANWGASGDKIVVEMLGDATVNATMSPLDTVDALSSDNFIWSDLFMGFNTTTATGANEWTNGYKVFSTTTQSFTY